jgi:hypothetical protein
VSWRVILTALYGAVIGLLMALENFHPEMSSAPLLVAWLIAPVVGFLVGRWWVVAAVFGVLAGRLIGWDPAENDGAPALSPLHLLVGFAYLGIPLLFGVFCSYVWRAWRRASVHPGG